MGENGAFEDQENIEKQIQENVTSFETADIETKGIVTLSVSYALKL